MSALELRGGKSTEWNRERRWRKVGVEVMSRVLVQRWLLVRLRPEGRLQLPLGSRRCDLGAGLAEAL